MSQLPCKNPNCNSYGQPHPNCKCYLNMAEGGDPRFCSGDNIHNPECEYNLPQMDPSDAISGFLAKHGVAGLINAVDDLQKYHSSIKKGHKSIDDHTEAIFSNKKIEGEDKSKSKKSLDDWMDRGGITDDMQNQIYKQHQTPQAVDDGGEAHEDDSSLFNPLLAAVHPEQNILLQTVKGRVSNYLNSQRPQKNMAKLPFDDEPDQTPQQKIYNQARDIAVDPLSVLKEVKKGTLEADHMKHFTSMYPELNDALQKKITKKITEAQLKNEKPDYNTRQGLSLLMGTELSGELKPQNIQAAQAVFSNSQGNSSGNTPAQPQQSSRKPKSKASSLSKSDQSFLTSNQALTSRQQKQ